MYTCTICGLDLPRSEFYPRKDGKLGIDKRCKSCQKERTREGKRLYKLRNKNNPQYIESNRRREESRNIRRRWDLIFEKYGITKFEWLSLFNSQGSKCAICGKSLDSDNIRDSHTDHCHDTGRVRGILCCGCNTFLGKYEKYRKLNLLSNIEVYLCQ